MTLGEGHGFFDTGWAGGDQELTEARLKVVDEAFEHLVLHDSRGLEADITEGVDVELGEARLGEGEQTITSVLDSILGLE